MRLRPLIILLAAVLCAGFIACDDTVSTIGSSLTGDNAQIVVDSSFTVTGNSVPVTSINPKTTNQLLGSINVPGYGSLKSDVVAQFLPSTTLDTEEFSAENIDSLILSFRYNRGAFIGDSVAPMGLTIYQLTRQLPKNIASDFDPEGYYNPTPIGTKIYNASTLNGTDKEKIADYRFIHVKLPVELGRNLFNAYSENPDNYVDGQVFAKNVFPGIYAKTTFGSGRMTLVSLCGMTMYMRKIYTPEGEEKPDTIDAQHLYYLVAPEVISNNNLTYAMSDKLSQMLDEKRTLLVAPTGSEIEMTFPIKEIVDKYRADTDGIAVVNGLSMQLPVDSIENGYGVTPPPYVLLVLKKDRDEFFAKNKLPDNVTSFYTTYDSSKGRYNFSNMRGYVMEMLSRDEIKPEDYTFSLIPVQVNFETLVSDSYYSTTQKQTESEVLPYLASPAMAEVKLNEAKIKFTYSLQTQK
ncbi:MAG: DUF4270 domain-containing protein [Muribaculaceae bacterium]|nr:DUF4270 domain-containing protein [Muribaculaceae bacterium]